MKYMGSKSKIVKDILPIMLEGRNANQYFVEPFAGGMNVTSEVSGNRIANDVHFYLIEMWKNLVNHNYMPKKITREKYQDVKNNQGLYPAHVVGWVGFNCSYSGKWFGGFAGRTLTKLGTVRDYQQEAIDNVSKQIPNLKGVLFTNMQYWSLHLPENSIVYCDPPYKGTTGYCTNFDTDIFWQWVRVISKQGHTVFVSEYAAPKDFISIWEKPVKSSLSANGKYGGSKSSIEKLFTLKSHKRTKKKV